MQSVLGISLGTRTIGTAVLQEGKIIHRQVHTFSGKWSVRKLKAILHTIEQLMLQYDTKYIAMKIPDELPSSQAFYGLIGGLNVFFDGKCLTVHYYTLTDLKERFCPNEPINKQELMNCILLKYPELIRLYKKEQQSRNAYYSRVFEAIGAAYAGYTHYLPM